MKMTEETPIKYIEEYLSKKEGEKDWVEYWTVLCGTYLMFYKYRPNSNEIRDAFKGCIEITEATKCVAAKRKQYSFPFYIITKKARYYFKTKSTLSRHRWFTAIDLASQRKSPIHKATEWNIPNPSSTENNNLPESLNNNFDDDDDNKSFDYDSDIGEANESTQASSTTNHVIIVQPCSEKTEIGSSRFLERKYPVIGSPNCTDDVKITDLEHKEAIDLDRRLHEIYCSEEEKPAKQHTKPVSYAYAEPTKSYGVPTYSSFKNSLRPFTNRLCKSAETLRDMSVDTTISNSRINTQEQKFRENGSLLHSIGPIQNKTLVKSRFSRHLISSAPDFKT